MNKKNILIVLLLLLLSTTIIYETYSIYRKENNGGASLRASIWNVELNQEGESGNIDLVSGTNNQDYILKIESTSEVDVSYKIEVSNVPTGVEISLDGGNFKPSNSSNKIIFDNAGKILYTDTNKEKTHTLTFKSNLGTQVENNRKIKIDVIAQQEI